MLEAAAVSVAVGLRPVLRRVSMAVEPGQAVALLGPNGAGKTTLLKVLGLVLRPDTGEVRIDGQTASIEHVAMRRHIAWLAHAPFFYGALTGRENLAFWGRLHGGEAGDPGPLLRRVGLAPFADDRVETYSAGMTKRLALARLALIDAPYWLMDEPLAGLDASGKGLFLEMVREALSRGRGVVLVSHEPVHDPALLTRVFLLSRGRIEAAASPELGMRSLSPPAREAP